MTLVALLPLELILILRGVWSIDKVRFRRSRAPAPGSHDGCMNRQPGVNRKLNFVRYYLYHRQTESESLVLVTQLRALSLTQSETRESYSSEMDTESWTRVETFHSKTVAS